MIRTRSGLSASVTRIEGFGRVVETATLTGAT
jgi:hypothetical protein